MPLYKSGRLQGEVAIIFPCGPAAGTPHTCGGQGALRAAHKQLLQVSGRVRFGGCGGWGNGCGCTTPLLVPVLGMLFLLPHVREVLVHNGVKISRLFPLATEYAGRYPLAGFTKA